MKGKLLGIILASFFLASCEKEIVFPDPTDYLVLFEYHYTNTTDEYIDRGWYILPDGSMRSFSLVEEWIIPGNDALLAADDLESNLSHTDVIPHLVDTSQLYFYHKDLVRVKNNDITEFESEMTDVGVASMYGFYRSEDGKYIRASLQRTGMVDRTRQGSEVEGLIEWLKNIGLQVGGFVWYDNDH